MKKAMLPTIVTNYFHLIADVYWNSVFLVFVLFLFLSNKLVSMTKKFVI